MPFRPVNDLSGFVPIQQQAYAPEPPPVAPPPPPQGALPFIGQNFMHGLIGPGLETLGQSAKYASDPGRPLYDAGSWLTDIAKRASERYAPLPVAEHHGPVVRALGEGAMGLGGMIPTLAGAGLAMRGMNLPAAGTALGSLTRGSVVAAPFAGSSGQIGLEEAQAAGLSDSEALEYARKQAALTGAMFSAIPMLGHKVLRMAAPVGATAETALPYITGQARVLPAFARDFSEATLIGGGAMAVEQAGKAAMANEAGIPGYASPGQAALATISPTAGMMALLAPFGLLGKSMAAGAGRKQAALLESADTDIEVRANVADQFARALHQVDPKAAQNFRGHVFRAVSDGEALTVGPHLLEPLPGMAEARVEAGRGPEVDGPGQIILPPMPDVTPAPPPRAMKDADIQRRRFPAGPGGPPPGPGGPGVMPPREVPIAPVVPVDLARPGGPTSPPPGGPGVAPPPIDPSAAPVPPPPIPRSITPPPGGPGVMPPRTTADAAAEQVHIDNVANRAALTKEAATSIASRNEAMPAVVEHPRWPGRFTMASPEEARALEARRALGEPIVPADPDLTLQPVKVNKVKPAPAPRLGLVPKEKPVKAAPAEPSEPATPVIERPNVPRVSTPRTRLLDTLDTRPGMTMTQAKQKAARPAVRGGQKADKIVKHPNPDKLGYVLLTATERKLLKDHEPVVYSPKKTLVDDKRPLFGYLGKDGEYEGYSDKEAAEVGYHHSLIVKDIDTYDMDSTLTFVRNDGGKDFTIKGEAAIDPMGSGKKHIGELADRLIDSGAERDSKLIIENMGLPRGEARYQGKSIGTLADFTTRRKQSPTKDTMPKRDEVGTARERLVAAERASHEAFDHKLSADEQAIRRSKVTIAKRNLATVLAKSRQPVVERPRELPDALPEPLVNPTRHAEILKQVSRESSIDNHRPERDDVMVPAEADPVTTLALRTLAKLFKKEIITYKAGEHVDWEPDGFYDLDRPNQLFVEVHGATNPVVTTVMHELTHSLKNNHADLYAPLEKAVMRLSSQSKVKQYLDDTNRTHLELDKENQREELTADVMAHFAGDKKFWESLERELRSEPPGVLRQIYDQIVQFFDSIMASFEADPQMRNANEMQKYVDNIESLRDRFIKAAAEASKRDQADELTRKGLEKSHRRLSPAKDEPVFYSALTKAVDDSPQKKATTTQWLGTLRNLQRQGVKQEELDWSGVQQWLKEQPADKVITREELSQYLRENEIKVEEKWGISDGSGKEEYSAMFVGGEIGRFATRKEAWDEVINTAKENLDAEHDLKQIYSIDSKREGAPTEFGVYPTKYHNMWAHHFYSDPPDWFADNADSKFFATREAAEEAYPRILEEAAKQHANSQGEVLNVLKESATTYDDYQLLGGTNYRELRLKLPLKGGEEQRRRISKLSGAEMTDDSQPDLQGTFASGHFGGDLNILAWTRINDRIGPNGEKILHVEEIQSDWHQRGAEGGYEGSPTHSRQAMMNRMTEQYEEWLNKNLPDKPELHLSAAELLMEMHSKPDQFTTDQAKWVNRFIEKWEDVDHPPYDGGAVPDAPFKSNWKTLVMKRLIRYAADNGYDKISWTHGEQQAKRWPRASIREGLIESYDKILPRELERYVKKWGGEVKWEDISPKGPKGWPKGQELPDGYRFVQESDGSYSIYKGKELHTSSSDTKRDAIADLKANYFPELEGEYAEVQPTLTITPAMREAVKGKAQVLFSPKKKPIEEQNEIERRSVNDIKQLPAALLDKAKTMAMGALGRRQIVDLHKDIVPELERYNDLMTAMGTERNKQMSSADLLTEKWRKVKDQQGLASLMNDATLHSLDPDKPLAVQTWGNAETYKDLNRRFQQLTPDAKEVYREARDSYAKQWKDIQDELRSRVGRAKVDEDTKAQLQGELERQFQQSLQGVYFPLSRFGDYYVSVRDGDGSTIYREHAPTRPAAEALRRELTAEYKASEGFTVSQASLSKQYQPGQDGASGVFMQQLHTVIDSQLTGQAASTLKDAVNQLYLKSSPDNNWAKRLVHRKGVAGYSSEARRAYAHHMINGGRQLARIRYLDQLQDSLGKMQREVDTGREQTEGFDAVRGQRAVNEINLRHWTAMNGEVSPLSTGLTSLGFFWYLGLSPSSAAVNLLQTPMLTFPMLGAKHGFGKAAAELGRAMTDAGRGHGDMFKVLKGDEAKAFQRAVDEGFIDTTLARDLSGVASGADTGYFSGAKQLTSGLSRMAAYMFHHSEKFNRQSTFLAGYRLAKADGMSSDAAYKSAVKYGYGSHFDYAESNKPRFFQGNLPRVFLLFKQYAQNMIYTMGKNFVVGKGGYAVLDPKASPAEREAAKTFLGILAMHTAAVGAFGAMPGLNQLYNAASWLGSEDDKPWDAKVALQNYLTEAVGPGFAEAVTHGGLRAIPGVGEADLFSRIGLNNLVFHDTQESLNGRDAWRDFTSQLLGPVVGMGDSFARGSERFGQGEYQRGFEAITPKFVRDPLKAYRYATEGVEDVSGTDIVENTTPYEEFLQAIGFTPSRVSTAYEGVSAIKGPKKAIGDRRQAILDQFTKAQLSGDEEEAERMMEEAIAFSDANPGFAIQPKSLMASATRTQMRQEEAEDGVYLAPKEQDLRELGAFAASVDDYASDLEDLDAAEQATYFEQLNAPNAAALFGNLPSSL